MRDKDRKHIAIIEILNAANKHYPEGYLSTYFNGITGRSTTGGGDTLARFIVGELLQTHDKKSSLKEQVAEAIQILDRCKNDVQSAIDGLLELQA